MESGDVDVEAHSDTTNELPRQEVPEVTLPSDPVIPACTDHHLRRTSRNIKEPA